MKKLYKIPFLYITAIVISLVAQSCKDYLEEDPKTLFTTAYFETAQGVQDAVNALYCEMRFIYTSNGTMALFCQGTDEWTMGEQATTSTSGDNLQHREVCQYTLTSGNGAVSSIWNFAFPMINMCNTIIESVPNVEGITAEQAKTLLGEAHFFRGLYYFSLVSQYGAVPVDLGGGELKPNTQPFFGFNRRPLDELLVKDYQAMIDDFTFASQNLPEMRDPANFKVTQAVALHMLSKTYIHRSYTAAAQAGDAGNALTAALELIDHQDKYGVQLLPDFGDVFAQGNDYNKEILYATDRLSGNENTNNTVFDPTGIGAYENHCNNNFTPNYQQTVQGRALINSRPLAYQRPLRKIAPTNWLLMTAFADKVNDSRYHKTFKTLYRTATVNEPGTTGYSDYVTLLAGLGMVIGDTAWYLPDSQAEANAINARGVNYFCVGPDDWWTTQNYEADAGTYQICPALYKFADSLRNYFNDASGRPFPVCRLGETYLLAAEAAMITGDNGKAADLINVLKRRAAYQAGLPSAEIDARYANIAVTSDDINLDFILDERSRELAGEMVRWPDLAVRKYGDGSSVLIERVKHNPDASGRPQAHHLVRPLPQGQIDAVNDPNRAEFQNPEY